MSMLNLLCTIFTRSTAHLIIQKVCRNTYRNTYRVWKQNFKHNPNHKHNNKILVHSCKILGAKNSWNSKIIYIKIKPKPNQTKVNKKVCVDFFSLLITIPEFHNSRILEFCYQREWCDNMWFGVMTDDSEIQIPSLSCMSYSVQRTRLWRKRRRRRRRRQRNINIFWLWTNKKSSKRRRMECNSVKIQNRDTAVVWDVSTFNFVGCGLAMNEHRAWIECMTYAWKFKKYGYFLLFNSPSVYLSVCLLLVYLSTCLPVAFPFPFPR